MSQTDRRGTASPLAEILTTGSYWTLPRSSPVASASSLTFVVFANRPSKMIVRRRAHAFTAGKIIRQVSSQARIVANCIEVLTQLLAGEIAAAMMTHARGMQQLGTSYQGVIRTVILALHAEIDDHTIENELLELAVYIEGWEHFMRNQGDEDLELELAEGNISEAGFMRRKKILKTAARLLGIELDAFGK